MENRDTYIYIYIIWQDIEIYKQTSDIYIFLPQILAKQNNSFINTILNLSNKLLKKR